MTPTLTSPAARTADILPAYANTIHLVERLAPHLDERFQRFTSSDAYATGSTFIFMMTAGAKLSAPPWPKHEACYLDGAWCVVGRVSACHSMKAWAPKTVFPHPWKATGVGSATVIKGEIDSSAREACYTSASANFAKG